MAYEVVVLETYETALEAAIAYRVSFFGARNAQSLLAEQESVEARLAAFPKSGAPVDAHAEANDGDVLRWVSVGPYIAVYETDSLNQRVLFEMLFYSREDWREKIRKVAR